MTFLCRYRRSFWMMMVLWIFCLATLYAYAQDSLTPEGFSSAEVATFTPTFTPSPTLMPTAFDTPTEIPTNPPTPMPTDIPTLEPTPTADLILSGDLSLTPSSEIDTTETPSATPITPTLDSSLTTTAIEATLPTQENPLLEMLDETPTLTPTDTESPTPVAEVETVTPLPLASPTMEMVIASGEAHYQNRLPDDSGIRVAALGISGQVLSEALTNAAGAYTISVPLGEVFMLRVAGDRHLAVEKVIQPGEMLPEIWLAGGDLNGDGCIGAADVGLLTQDFEQPNSGVADITGDGITDDADLAILAGNYAPNCEPTKLSAATPTASPEATLDTGTPIPAETISVDTATPEAPITLEPTEETITAEANPIVDIVPLETPTELVTTVPAVEAGS